MRTPARLSEAHNQIKKNAMRTDDVKLAQQSLVRAVEAAQRALAVAPDRLDMALHLEQLTNQLASIKADQKAAGSVLPK
jgi:hypothetical protein